MGLFDDFDIDMDEVKESGGFSFDDGWYPFEISEALRQNGTKNDPDDTKFIIKYDLDEAGTYWEWFTLAVDGDAAHPKAKSSLGFLKTRLLGLGLKASELNDFEPEDLEGIRGDLELKTTKNKKGEFQNIKNLKLDDEGGEPDDEPEPAPAPRRRAAKPKDDEDDTEAQDRAAKARVAARRAARDEESDEKPAPRSRRTVTKDEPTKPARGRSRRSSDDEDENENPFG